MSSPLQQVDANLRAIHALEGASTLPALPAEVTLDLAGNTNMTPDSLNQLLLGMESDINSVQRAEPVEVRQPDVWTPLDPEYETGPAVGRLLYGVTGTGRVEQYDSNAVVEWKQRAVDRGYLDLTPAQIQDQRWLPEYSNIAAEMMRDQARREFSGEKPGSLSVDNVMNFVEEWLSPKGLYTAAIELDLFWDFNSIGREMADWGDKLRAWREEPWNPGRLIDALTGPLDDIIFPVVNWGLMLVGVGQVYNTVRWGLKGAQAGAASAKAIAGINTGSKGMRFLNSMTRPLRAVNAADDVAFFKNQSFMANMLRQPTGEATGAVASGLDALRGTKTVGSIRHGMEQWRNLSGVVAAKKINQQVLRLGVSSNLQGLVDDERGRSLATETRLDEAVNAVMSNPVAEWSVDLLIYPPNLFERGSIRAGLAATGRGLQKVTGFKKVTESQEMTLGWHDAVRAYIGEEGGEAAVGAFDDAVRDKGVIGAMADQLTGGDVEKLGEAMAFVSTMGVVNWAARTRGGLDTVVSGALKGDELSSFHKARNHIIAQLRHYDPDDVDEVINAMAAHGLNLEETPVGLITGGEDGKIFRVAEARQNIRATWKEPEDVVALRGGAVADGDVRLYGRIDPETGNVRWSAEEPLGRGGPAGQLSLDEDPFFVDVNPAEFGVSADEILAEAEQWAQKVERRYRFTTGRRARLSEAQEIGRYDPVKLERLKALVHQHNDRRAETLASLMANLNPEMIRQSVYEALPTFGRWTDFSDAVGEVRMLQRQGLLDETTLAPVITDSGRRAAVNPPFAKDGSMDKWSREMAHLMLQLGDDPELQGRMMESVFAPLVREIDPAAQRFTVMKSDTATKQEALAFVASVNSHLSKIDDAEAFMRNHPDLFARLDDALEGAQQSLIEGAGQRNLVARAVTNAVADTKLMDDPKAQLHLRRLVNWAMNNGVSMKDVQRALGDQTSDLLRLQDTRWGRYRVAEQVGMDAEDATTHLRAKLKELKQQVNFIAAEVDAPDSLKGFLSERGYKLVYGVNFAAPEDLMDIIPAFDDVSQAHIRSSRLQSFFGRKDPDYVRIQKTRIAKSSLFSAMRRAASQGRDVRLDLADDASVNRLIQDLYGLLDDVQEEAMTVLETSRHRPMHSRIGARVSTANVPFDLSRLPSAMSRKEFLVRVQGLGYTQDEALAIMDGLMRSQALGFKEQGLYAIESKLRSQNNVVEGLRLLGRHQASNRLTGAVHKATATGGGLAGATLAANEDGEFGFDAENIMQGLAGAAVGVGGAHLLGRKLGHLKPVDAGFFANRAAGLESSQFAKWGYLADNLANVRDLFRFSLSPIFDASRYSEAVILSQIGELPEGVRNLRMNQSPTGVRRAIARQLRSEGATAEQARRGAEAAWAENRARFAAAAKNDFEMETIDSIGRRFSSVGVLGFSPVNWMESTFWHLTEAGVDSRKAYETVREIYTYGVTGRSSAELSANFVFFPFSFTKKVLGHMTGFIQQDLGRLILIQDGLQAYQMLNERYDLSDEFRDRLPIISRMNRLNVLAYGLSPGRFGGVNAPMIGAMRDTPVLGDLYWGPEMDEVAGLFVPQMVSVRNDADASELWDITKQMLPAINDVNTLIGDAIEQGYVVASDSHMTRQAEARRGWDEWRTYQDSVQPYLENIGISWAQAMQDPALGALIRQKRAEISAAYPQWKHAMGDGIARSAAIDLEIQERLNQPDQREDLQLAQFHTALNTVSEVLSSQGLSMSNPEEVPPEVFQMMRKLAIELTTAEPRFKRLYDRFYRRMFGDIATELI